MQQRQNHRIQAVVGDHRVVEAVGVLLVAEATGGLLEVGAVGVHPAVGEVLVVLAEAPRQLEEVGNRPITIILLKE